MASQTCQGPRLASALVVIALAVYAPICDAQSESDTDKGLRQLILDQARAMGDATLKGDFEALVDRLYPKVLETLGGRDKALQTMRETLKLMKAKGIEFKDYQFGEPGKIARGKLHLFSVVPETVVLSVPEGTLTQRSFLLAIRDNAGKDWFFLDGGTQPTDAIKQFVPDLPEDLKLPPRQKPVLTPKEP